MCLIILTDNHVSTFVSFPYIEVTQVFQIGGLVQTSVTPVR